MRGFQDIYSYFGETGSKEHLCDALNVVSSGDTQNIKGATLSALFRTEAEVMVATAGRVDDTNNEVQGELQRLHGVVDGVRASWVGSAQVSFDGLMQRWNTSAQQLREALQAISDNLRSNAHHFENVEADNAQAFAQVGGDGLAL